MSDTLTLPLLQEPLDVDRLSDDEQAIAAHLLAKLAARAHRNRLRTGLYDMHYFAEQVGKSIPPQYATLSLVLGWAAKAVDGLARRCHLDGFVWPGGDLEAIGMPGLQAENFLLSKLSQARTDSLLHGVSFLIAGTGEAGAGEPHAVVTAADALHATGEWNARTNSLDAALAVEEQDTDHQILQYTLYLPNLAITVRREVNGRWAVMNRRRHVFGMPVQPLIYRPRLSRPMGRSRLTPAVIGLQFAAVRALVRMEAHMDVYAIPRFFLLGAEESVFKNPDGTPKTEWQIVMGRMFGIPDDPLADDPALARADVKQYRAESPAPHLAQLNSLAKLSAAESHLPDSDFAITDMANPTSADSYWAGRENLFSEAEGATEDWSVPIVRTVATALAMWNELPRVPPEWLRIEPRWRPPQFTSKAAQADAGMKQLTAIPWLGETEVGLELIGLTGQQIRLAQAERRRAAGRDLIAELAGQALPAEL